MKRNLQEETWESRIVGGAEAGIDEHPLYVNWGGQCGASLIAREWIMSAAHCDPISTDNVKIDGSRGVVCDVGRGEMAAINDHFPHPNCNGNTHDNDIIIMKLDEPVNFDPIPLDFNETAPSDNEDSKVIGFGRLESGGSSPRELQEVAVQQLDDDPCNQHQSYDGDATNQMLCAGASGGGKDSCQGDSGGPIFTHKGKTTQVGVVSWGRGCARPDEPGVHARVSSFESWIKGMICTDEEHTAQHKPDFCDGGESNPSPVHTRPPTRSPTSSVDSEDGSGSRPPARPPAPEPTSSGRSGGSDSAKLCFKITCDEFPDEVSWQAIQNGQIVASGGGNSNQVGETVRCTHNVSEGHAEFVLEDAAEDGICCCHGYGGHEIRTRVDGNVRMVAESDGTFSSSEITTFAI